MRHSRLLKAFAAASLLLTTFSSKSHAQAITENFDNITTLTGSGWFMQNNSSPVGSTGWFQGNSTVFSAYNGAATAYIGANFNNTGNVGVISNWLGTPARVLKNGDVITFYTRQATSNFGDRLQVRMSTNGTSTNVGTGSAAVGDFTTQVIEINPSESGTGYPEVWTQYTYTVSGLSNSTMGRFAFRYYLSSGGFSGTASDYIGIDNFTYTPNCVGVTISPSTVPGATVGSAYSQTFTLGNSYGSPTYAVTAGALPPGLTLSTGGTLSGTPTATGSYTFSITATDGTPSTCTNTISYTLVVSCPAITLSPGTVPGGTAGIAYSQNISQTGSTGTTVTYSVTAGALPTGVTLASNGLLSGTPTVTGNFNFTVTATDNYGCTSSQAYTLQIACPVITVTPSTLPNATVTQIYTQVVSNTGGVGTTTYAITGGALPAGLTLSSNGTISGTPTATGMFGVTITATDANGCTGSISYTLTVTCQPITIDQTSLPNAVITSAYSQTLSQTGGYLTETYTITAGSLPPGVILMSGGVISGTPTATGTFNFDVTITDANGCTGVQSLSITVDCQPISIDQATLSNGTASTAYTETLTQTGGVGTGGYTLTAGALPGGITLSSGGVISGTPTVTGTFSFDITFTDDNGCTDVQSYTITIACQAITIDQTTLPNGVAGLAYSQTLTQTGGIGAGTFAVTGGALPAGITLSAGGVVGGTPTVTGTFNFDVTATDANGCTSNTQSFTLVIDCDMLLVTQVMLPPAYYNTPYSEQIVHMGGVGPFTFTIISGSLPAGLTMSASGLVSGTSAVGPGNYSIDVYVTDANNCSSLSQTIPLQTGWPLAITLKEFKATTNGKGSAAITWEVAKIEGTEKFAVERSVDGKEFSTIAYMNAVKDQAKYAAVDSRMAEGANYYRLRTTELNGEVSYSNVVRVANTAYTVLVDVALIPNLVENTATLQLSSNISGKAELRIIDAVGKEVFRSSNQITKGANAIPLNLTELAQGTYTLQVITEGDMKPVKFVKY